MAADRQTDRYGDPAFRRSDAVTHEPVVEEQRESPVSRPGVPTLAVWIVAAGFVLAAVVAGVAVGGSYAIPFAIFAALALGFLATNWALGRRRALARDDENPVPHTRFDERSDEPSAPASPGEREVHEDLDRSTGWR